MWHNNILRFLCFIFQNSFYKEFFTRWRQSWSWSLLTSDPSKLGGTQTGAQSQPTTARPSQVHRGLFFLFCRHSPVTTRGSHFESTFSVRQVVDICGRCSSQMRSNSKWKKEIKKTTTVGRWEKALGRNVPKNKNTQLWEWKWRRATMEWPCISRRTAATTKIGKKNRR